jgi:hypothetical protein
MSKAHFFLYFRNKLRIRETSGFRRCVVEALALLRCYVAQAGSWLPTFRDSLSVQSSNVKLSVGSIFKGQAVRTPWPLKMGPICCSETSVTNYQPVTPNISQKRSEFHSIFTAERNNLKSAFGTGVSNPRPSGFMQPAKLWYAACGYIYNLRICYKNCTIM